MKSRKHNLSELNIKYVEQRFEGFEIWVQKGQSDWIRLDFLLEYYLFGNVNLSKKYKGLLSDEMKAKQYYNLLYEKFIQATSGGYDFDFQKYTYWLKNNQLDINKARDLLHLT